MKERAQIKSGRYLKPRITVDFSRVRLPPTSLIRANQNKKSGKISVEGEKKA